MLLTLATVIATVGLVSGLGSIPRPVAATHGDVVTFECTYEGGPSGDVAATVANDQGAGTADGFFDDGGCIWVSSEVNARQCAYTVTRADGLTDTLDGLTSGAVAEDRSVSVSDLAAADPGHDIDCGLRELPIDDLVDKGHDPTRVVFQIEVVDDAYGEDVVGGAFCTDEDGDGVACELGEWDMTFCGTSPVRFLDLTAIDAMVVFTNGPAAQAEHCDIAKAPSATTGGIFDASGGVSAVMD